MNIYSKIQSSRQSGKKQFAVLVDPDKSDEPSIAALCKAAAESKVDYFFVGGSLLSNGNLQRCVSQIKSNCSIPVILFPGNTLQIDEHADAILFLSLISGRNADLLIGNHVIAAPVIRNHRLEAIATGYMIVESGMPTSVQYMSHTVPIPHDKNDIAACTAMAGELLGLKMIFMDAGSGAINPVSEKMITSVRKNIALPIIIGGGIRNAERAVASCNAGADIIVVGNSIEKDYSLINTIAEAIHKI